MTQRNVAQQNMAQRNMTQQSTTQQNMPQQTLSSGCVHCYLWLIVAAQILLHLPALNLPPSGQHSWRQVVGYAAARSYYQEGASFWYPRTDIRLYEGDQGEGYHEFPILYWLAGKGYSVLGEKDYIPRTLALLFNLSLIFSSYYLARGLSYSCERALWFSFLISSSPLYFYYSATFVPNLMGVSVFVAATALLIPSLKAGLISPRLITATLLVLLATLMKPTYLFFGLTTMFLFLTLPTADSFKKMLAFGIVAGFIILGVNGAVIRHARAIHESSPLERAVHTPVGPAERPESVQHLFHCLQTGFFNWFVEMLVSYGALPLFLYGGWIGLRNRNFRHWSGKFWIVWSISFAIYISLFIIRLQDHDYYITSMLPIAALLSSAGAEHLLTSKKKKIFFAVLILLVGYTRILGRWTVNLEIPEQLLRERQDIAASVPDGERVLITGDNSPSVFLYMLNRKGLSLGSLHGSFYDIDPGQFDWLIDYSPEGALNDDIREHFNLEFHEENGDFVIYRSLP